LTAADAPRALVLGARGMLGHQVVAALAEDFDVHATVRGAAGATREDVTLHGLDAAAPAGLDDLLAAVRPAVVVNCIGIVKQLAEAKDPVASIKVNALFPHEAARACARHGARLVHVSTDCVFSGELAAPERYTEDHWPDPRDLYGRTKLLGEVDAPALTLRTSIIGRELGRATGLLEWFLAQEGRTISGFRNAWFSGLTTIALAGVIRRVALAHPGLAGLYQVSSEPISKYDLLLALRDALGVDCAIEPTDEPRINRALDSSRFRRETGIEIPSWDAMLSDYRKEPHARIA
jgi:dTDP-4-dehydrorhamnose reductase